jgi:succinyl-diaminopimelate desuccinylase
VPDAASDIQHTTLRLAKALIGCRSVTPSDGGSLDVITARLSAAGFRCERMDRGPVSNLWARRGRKTPVVCLAGHVDVVTPGALDQWATDPFVAAEREGYLVGRGAADMKTSVAAMVTAAERVATTRPDLPGSIAILLTSDEEGAAVAGTAAVVEALRKRGESIDACILGEPTSTERLGDTIKNGRRGSLNGVLTVRGVQCHIAYPERGLNPVHAAIPALAELVATAWDRGNEYFPPTSLQISNIHAGTGANNVVPGTLEVQFNFRFSPESSPEGLQARVHDVLGRHGLAYSLEWSISGLPFITPAGRLVDVLIEAIRAVTGLKPSLSTGGGTSDGRFIATLAREVVEFGPLAEGMHGVNEKVRLADIAPLSAIYERAIVQLLTA